MSKSKTVKAKKRYNLSLSKDEISFLFAKIDLEWESVPYAGGDVVSNYKTYLDTIRLNLRSLAQSIFNED